jgi:hypothetical protein
MKYRIAKKQWSGKAAENRKHKRVKITSKANAKLVKYEILPF